MQKETGIPNNKTEAEKRKIALDILDKWLIELENEESSCSRSVNQDGKY
jgi:hypothetical protein